MSDEFMNEEQNRFNLTHLRIHRSALISDGAMRTMHVPMRDLVLRRRAHAVTGAVEPQRAAGEGWLPSTTTLSAEMSVTV